MKGIVMSKAQAEEHQRKHGFKTPVTTEKPVDQPKLPKPRMNATERAYGLILEAMKRRGEIAAYRFEGIKLAWGTDPVSGRSMYYTPDFFVRDDFDEIVLVEVKGSRIWPQDWIRFKGCRAAWPMFRFELHQKTKEGWKRLL